VLNQDNDLPDLRERMGHSKLELLGGIVVGIVTAYFVHLVFNSLRFIAKRFSSLSNSNSLLSLLSTLTLQQRWLLLTFMGLKIALLWFVPLTGDEAYFIVWGQDLSLGYYDHPPAVGWVLYLLSGIADNLVVYRSLL
jgi:hypothetical protein